MTVGIKTTLKVEFWIQKMEKWELKQLFSQEFLQQGYNHPRVSQQTENRVRRKHFSLISKISINHICSKAPFFILYQKKVKKLTKFFGDEPPLLRLYLKVNPPSSISHKHLFPEPGLREVRGDLWGGKDWNARAALPFRGKAGKAGHSLGTQDKNLAGDIL